MLTCLPPEEWSSPLTFCSRLLPVLSLSIHRTIGEGLIAGSVYPLLPQSIFLRSFPRQPSCTHQGGWTRLPDPTVHFPPSSLIHPGLLMRGVHLVTGLPLLPRLPFLGTSFCLLCAYPPAAPSSFFLLLCLLPCVVFLEGLMLTPFPHYSSAKQGHGRTPGSPHPPKEVFGTSPWGPHHTG